MVVSQQINVTHTGREDVDTELGRVRELLKAMSLEAGPLIELLKQTKGRGTGAITWRGQQLTYEENVAVRLFSGGRKKGGLQWVKGGRGFADSVQQGKRSSALIQHVSLRRKGNRGG